MEKFATRTAPENRLLIFARVPEFGQVKTRLARDLGDDKTFALYRAMLRDLLSSVGPSAPDMEVEVLWTGSPSVDGATLQQHFPGFELSQQAGETLGVRLAVAFTERIAFYRASKLVAIGTDDPSVNRETIRCAFRLLDSCEWTLGPSADGGYYLIGCRAEVFTIDVFEGIDWGTDTVFATTARKIRGLGQTVAMLPCRRDIDVIDDLRSYSAMADGDRHMDDLLRSWGWLP
jgi:uncharacterized protein